MDDAKNAKISGIVPPIITAFDKEGNVDEKAQREVVSFLKQYVQGFYACGTYGSGPLMNVKQRKKCAEVIVDETGGEIPVVVHVGATATSTCIELGKHAQEIGATAVAAVPPYYFRHTEGEVLFHFQRLVESVELPVYIYNNPKTTGFSVSPRFLNELAKIGVRGVKDSSFDILTFYGFLRAVKAKDDFAFIIGTEAFILPAVPMGAQASIAGLGNAIPEPVVELFETVKRGDLEKARPLQMKILDLRDIVHYGPTVPVVQAILKERGVNSGYPKMPFQEIDEDLRKRVMEDLGKFGVL